MVLRVRATADPRNLIWVMPAKGVQRAAGAASVRRDGGHSIPGPMSTQHPAVPPPGPMHTADPATRRSRVHALVVADGERPERAGLDAGWPGWDDRLALVIAADGGAATAESLGLSIDLLVGDADSIHPSDLVRLESRGVAVERAPAAKDASDTELAVLAALARGATRVTIVGALGGSRLEHLLANVQLLALPALQGCEAELLSPLSRVTFVRAPGPDGAPVRRALPGRCGDFVSLFPLGEQVEGIVTEGLAFPLRDEPLVLGPARGLSNVRTADVAAVSLRRGALLIVETIADAVGGGSQPGGLT